MRSGQERRKPVVLAVASGGGHWSQLLRLRPAFEGYEMVYASTIVSHADRVPGCRFFHIADANRWQRARAAMCALQVAALVVRVRPDVAISTGALPGFFLMFFGRLLRRKTVWLDSVANADELSMSGAHAGRFADVWLTQWQHLALPGGPTYAGSVLARDEQR